MMSKRWLEISNQGEVEIGAFTLMGASSKRGDSSMIGFFGSGIKYAIISLKRMGYDLKIFSGENEIKITFEEETFRGNQFSVLTINGIRTSLTMDMGPDWTAWQAVREIFCNAIDEKGYFHNVTEEILWGAEGYTKFYIECINDVASVVENWNQYFTFERKDSLYKLARAKETIVFYPYSENFLFRKGILCVYPDNNKRVFSYDSDNISINESRIAISDQHAIRGCFTKLLIFCDNYDVLRYALKNFYGSQEACISFTMSPDLAFSETTKRVLVNHEIHNGDGLIVQPDEYDINKAILLPAWMCRVIDEMYKGEIRIHGYSSSYLPTYEILNKTDREIMMIRECEYLWKELQFDKVFGVFPEIEVVNFNIDLNVDDIDNKIFISRTVISGTKSDTMQTLLATRLGDEKAKIFLKYAVLVNQIII